MTPAYVLAYLPRLMRELEQDRADILFGSGRGEAFAGGGRGGPSDPTARKALRLVELSEREALLREVFLFCCGLSDYEKRAVVTRWRMPWDKANLLPWLAVVRKLEQYLSRNRSAGAAAG